MTKQLAHGNRVLRDAQPAGVQAHVIAELRQETITVSTSKSGIHHAGTCRYNTNPQPVTLDELNRATCCSNQHLAYPALYTALIELQWLDSEVSGLESGDCAEFWKVVQLDRLSEDLAELRSQDQSELIVAIDLIQKRLDAIDRSVDLDEADRTFKRAQLARIAAGCHIDRWQGPTPVLDMLNADRHELSISGNHLYEHICDRLEEGCTPDQVADQLGQRQIEGEMSRRIASVVYQHLYSPPPGAHERAEKVRQEVLRYIAALDRELADPTISFGEDPQTVIIVRPYVHNQPHLRFVMQGLRCSTVLSMTVDGFNAEWLARSEISHINVNQLHVVDKAHVEDFDAAQMLYHYVQQQRYERRQLLTTH